MKTNFWLKNTIKKEINQAYTNQNISRLEYFYSENQDLLKIINCKEHPLIDSIDKKNIKNINFLLLKYSTEDLIEKSLIHAVKTKNKLAEETIVLFCQKKKTKLKHSTKNFKNFKQLINISNKYN